MEYVFDAVTMVLIGLVLWRVERRMTMVRVERRASRLAERFRTR